MSVNKESISINPEEKSLIHEGKSEPQEDKSVTFEDKSVQTEENSIIHKDKSIPHEDNSVPQENKSVTHDDKSVQYEDQSEPHEDPSENSEDKSVTHDGNSVLHEGKSVTDEGISESHEVKSVTHEDVSITLDGTSIIPSKKQAYQIATLTKEPFEIKDGGNTKELMDCFCKYAESRQIVKGNKSKAKTIFVLKKFCTRAENDSQTAIDKINGKDDISSIAVVLFHKVAGSVTKEDVRLNDYYHPGTKHTFHIPYKMNIDG
ncbi:uncharacterized protein LOC128217201 [Mya arenaria]|nr:uncharacterized protein LOC128217201 [Mya arenaria]